MSERRARGLTRVPFVRRCQVDTGRGTASAFTVNLSVLGAYIAPGTPGSLDDWPVWPAVGEALTLHFAPPGSDQVLVLRGVVTWVNPRQQHPVHSLPPGFGMHFDELDEPVRLRLERIVVEQAGRQTHLR